MIPTTMTHLGPNRSTNQPVIGASKPPSNLPIPAATEVEARVKPSSEAMGLKSAEKP